MRRFCTGGFHATISRSALAAPVREDGRKEEEIDELGVELRAAPVERSPDARRRSAVALAIASAVGDRVEGVGDRDDARRERDAAALEPARIALAVPALVVREHAVGEIGIEGAQRLEHVGAARGVRGDGAPLGRA